VDVLVLGAGLMGAQIGCEYAVGGHRVTFVARDRDAAARRVADAFALAARLGLETRGSYRIATASRAEPELVVESLPEDLALKAELLAPYAGGGIIATNTSSLSVTELGERLGAPERTVGTHYFNPPLLMPTVEVVAGEHTDRAVVDRVSDILRGLGKQPITVHRDVPGFIWNRLQAALMREALWLVEEGVATAEDVDTAMREGLARRWRHLGPFEVAALGGVEVWKRVGANLLPQLSAAQDLAALDRHVSAEGLAEAAAVRDEALAEELYRDRARARSTTRPS
jgi:3-hydroxybutyryl-CoA dehydrogenase